MSTCRRTKAAKAVSDEPASPEANSVSNTPSLIFDFVSCRSFYKLPRTAENRKNSAPNLSSCQAGCRFTRMTRHAPGSARGFGLGERQHDGEQQPALFPLRAGHFATPS